GSILDSGDEHAGEDVIASGLRLVAGRTVGTAANPFETAVATLTARATTGLFIVQSTALTIDAVAVTVAAFGVTDHTDAAQTDIVSTTGVLNLSLLAGSLTMVSGTRLATTSGDIIVNVPGRVLVSIIDSGTGTLTLTTGADLVDNLISEAANLRGAAAVI